MLTTSTTGLASQPAARQYGDIRTNLTQSLLAQNPGLKVLDAQVKRDDARLSSIGKMALALTVDAPGPLRVQIGGRWRIKRSLLDRDVLGVATLERGGAVHAGVVAVLGMQRAEVLLAAAVGADALGEHGLAVGGGGLFVGGAGRFHRSGAGTAIEQRQRQLRPQRPEQVGCTEQVGQWRAPVAARRRQRERREVRSAGHTDLRIGGGGANARIGQAHHLLGYGSYRLVEILH